jgi:superfamily I DNA and RNA helicase
MGKLIEEYHRLKERDYILDFRYPDQEERNKLKIIHRDMTEAERSRLNQRTKGLEQLLIDLENGNINSEDIDDSIKQKLEELLMKK